MLKQQTSKPFWHFFQTESGRKVVFTSACLTTIGLFVGNYLPQTFCLKYYREFVQCYQNGVERPVPEKVLQRIEIAVEKLNVPAYQRKLIKPFTVFGFDLFQAGTAKNRFGGAIGIPVNYAYETVEDINRNDIRFRDKKIDWKSDSGKLLEDAIILSEEEQIFGLSKCILQLQTHRVLFNSIFPSASFLLVYTIGSYMNQRFSLLARPASMRFVLYGILSMFGFGLWSFMKDFNQVRYDSNIDEQLSSMGAEFIEAGVGFYDKELKKNMALRALIKDNTYSARGNVNYLLRQKSLPLTIRKSFFDFKWKELQENKQKAPSEELVL